MKSNSKAPAPGINSVKIFADLSHQTRADMAREMKSLHLARGDVLVRQGEDASALFIVVSGRFAVSVSGKNHAIAEIGPGQPVGEIAFLSGGARTATVTALRDAVVLKLERAQFDQLCQVSPSIWPTLTVAMAKRLASMNNGSDTPTYPRPRTIAIIPAGPGAIPRHFIDQLVNVFSNQANTILVDAPIIASRLNRDVDVNTIDVTRKLNTLEADHDYVVYLGDPDLTPWSRKTIRQADLILSVGQHLYTEGAEPELNSSERYAQEFHEPDAHRLVLLHDVRGPIAGTMRWLKHRDGIMHHHVARDHTGDYERLFRFINGTALGLVACGGGAYCAAHTGLYKALIESGITFDIMGGTSGGAAMTAGYALGVEADEMDRQIHEMFVENKAMGRYTLPVYSLLDHSHFDEQLRKCYGEQRIEDMWIPFYAVSTNLSRHELHRHRVGRLWQAIRASSAIPALFPPFYSDDKEMLVDGALIDNVPVRIMHELKSGPNIVLNFKVPRLELFDVDYEALPSRTGLLALIANPMRREALFQAPSLSAVLIRAMMSNRNEYLQHMCEGDLMFMPPLPEDMTILDWHRHTELMQLSYDWGLSEIARLRDTDEQIMALDSAVAE